MTEMACRGSCSKTLGAVSFGTTSCEGADESWVECGEKFSELGKARRN